MRKVYHSAKILFFLCIILSLPLTVLSKNGFDLNGALVDSTQILSGGPPKDGIPALTKPLFISASENNFLQDNDRVLGIYIEDTPKAYPIRILNWHEVVNDRIGNTPFVITYCPLCGTGVAFSSVVDSAVLTFGVSGLLYNSDVLLYDRQTESLWSQVLGKAVTGAHRGKSLEQIGIVHTSWKQWRTLHPQTMVLSQETGFSRDYSHNPYGGYADSENLYFPVTHISERDIHLKETVLGVKHADAYKAYPFSTLEKLGKTQIKDTIGGAKVFIHWDEEGRSAEARDEKGELLDSIQGFWFAWYAFFPQTEVYSP